MGRGISTREILESSAHETLRGVVVWFRVLAYFAWMLPLGIATLLTDDGAGRGWVVASEIVAFLSVLATIWLARRRALHAVWWVIVDGGIAVFVVLSPSLAQSRDLFYGGFALSWLLLVVWARPTVRDGTVAVAVLVGSVLVQSWAGIREIRATDFIGDIAVFVVSAIAYGWGLYLMRAYDVERARAELRLRETEVANERRRSSEEAGRQFHDSVVQELVAIRLQPDKHEVEQVARRLERMTRGEINRLNAVYPDGFRVALYDGVEDIAEKFNMAVEPPKIDGDCAPGPATRAVVSAACEALTNAVKWSGTDQISVSGRVADGEIVAKVTDFGRGLDPSQAQPDVAAYVTDVGGTATVETVPGKKTSWTITAPCPD